MCRVDPDTLTFEIDALNPANTNLTLKTHTVYCEYINPGECCFLIDEPLEHLLAFEAEFQSFLLHADHQNITLLIELYNEPPPNWGFEADAPQGENFSNNPLKTIYLRPVLPKILQQKAN